MNITEQVSTPKSRLSNSMCLIALFDSIYLVALFDSIYLVALLDSGLSIAISDHTFWLHHLIAAVLLRWLIAGPDHTHWSHCLITLLGRGCSIALPYRPLSSHCSIALLEHDVWSRLLDLYVWFTSNWSSLVYVSTILACRPTYILQVPTTIIYFLLSAWSFFIFMAHNIVSFH